MSDLAQSTIGHAFAAIIVGVFAAFLTKSFRAPPRLNRDGEFVLEYPLVFKAGVVIVWIIGVAVAAAFYLHGQSSIAFGMIACVAALGFPLYLTVFTFRVEFDALHIRVHWLWRSVRFIPWGSVRAIRHQRIPDGYAVATEMNGQLRLKSVLVGLETFLDQAEQRGIPVQRVSPVADRMMQRRRS